MSDNPYANLGSEVIQPAPERTSVLAILSLVIAIISIIPLFCVLPASGALAVIFGGAALMFIHRERGRLSGTGLAATGIVLGLLVTVAQIVVVVMASRLMQMVRQAWAEPVRASLAAMEAGDLPTARKLFPPAVDAQISDQMLTDFVAAYHAQSGKFIGFPDSILGVVQTYMEIGPGFQAVSGRNDFMPLPGKFAKGHALIAVVFDQASMQQGAATSVPARNIGIINPTGKAVWLLDPATMPPTFGPGSSRGGNTTIQVGPKGVKIDTGPGTPAVPETPEAPGGSGPGSEPEKPADPTSTPPSEPPPPADPS